MILKKFTLLIAFSLLMGCEDKVEIEEIKEQRNVSSNPLLDTSGILGTWKADFCDYSGEEFDTWLIWYHTFSESSHSSKFIEYSDSNCTIQVSETDTSTDVPYIIGQNITTEDGLNAVQLYAYDTFENGFSVWRTILSIQDECLYFGVQEESDSKFPTTLRYEGCFKLEEI